MGWGPHGHGVCNQPCANPEGPGRRRIRAENYARQVQATLRQAREDAANARAEQRRSRARADP
eukprot:1634955-Alexandrium_andersonii.AAC.1